MPELPEVETMVRGLRPALEGRVLEVLQVRDAHLLQGCTAETVERSTTRARVETVQRRGKWVVVALEEPRGMIVVQPRMTGAFYLVEPPRAEHIRLIFHLEGSPRFVWFCDPRRLGKVAWYPDAAAAGEAFARSHGPDALEIGLEELRARLRRTTRGIKPTLLDQKVLAGIGNIYADEILHLSRLHPERPANGLTRGEVTRLHAAIRPVLDAAIAAEGASFDRHYRTVLGAEGGFLAISRVHRRKGLPCTTCGAAILKTRIAGLIGRPTYYCPTCQRPRPARSRGGGSAGPNGGDRVS